MTEYAIYTYGNGKVLWEILNILGIIFKSEHTYTTSFLKFTLVIGGVWATTFAVFKGNIGVFAKAWFVPTFLLVNLLLIPKSTVHIFDRVDRFNHYQPVANIPVGIGLALGFPSMIGDYLTNIIDEKLNGNEATRYMYVGPLFGARLAMKSQSITITDSTMRQNLKDFIGQCFMWPFVFTDIKPGRNEAQKSKDILGFIEKNAHPSLGSYWSEGGQKEFKSCSACAKEVRLVLTELVRTQSIPNLAAVLFGAKDDQKYRAGTELTKYFGDAWQMVAKESEGIRSFVTQSLLINTYRERLDDRREDFGANRLDPSLLKVTQARSVAHQNVSSLQKGLLVGEYIPMLQGIIMALVMMLFVLVIPLSFLPGGIKYFKIWLQLCLWVNTWPIFYSILNGIGNIYLENSSITATLEYGDGLSLATQSGLADSCYDAYCWIMGLMLTIPYLSWAFLTKSSYALGQSLGGLLDGLGQNASRLSSENVDGNINFDNTSIGNRNLFGAQIAQQNLGAHVNYGEVVNDGTLSLAYGPGGAVVGNAAMSNLATQVNTSESLANTASKQFTDSYQKLGQSALSYADHLAHTSSEGIGLTSSEAYDRRSSAEDFKRLSKEFGQKYGISAEAAANLSLGINTPVGGVGVSGSVKESGDLSKALQSGLGKSLTEAASKVDGYAKQDQFNASDSRTRDHAENFLQSKIATQNWSSIESFAKENRASLQTNMTDDIIGYAANSMFGGDKSAAIKWANDNRSEFETMAQGFVGQQAAYITERVRETDHVLSKQEAGNLLADNPNILHGSQMGEIAGNHVQERGNQLLKDMKDSIQENTKLLEKRLNEDSFDVKGRGIKEKVDLHKKHWDLNR